MNIDQQPVRARFGETNILNTFLTPRNPDIQSLYDNLTAGLSSVRERVAALWAWVANIPYTPHIAVRLSAGKKSIYQNDFWAYPAETVQLNIANCFNKSTLLCSLLMNDPSIRSRVILGNLNSNGIGGHAWCCRPFTKINCYGEIKDIQDIKVGEEVIGQDGGLHKVTSIMDRLFTGNLVSITRVYFANQPLEVTPEHPILTNCGWKAAGDVRVRDCVIEPITRGVNDRETWSKSMRYSFIQHSGIITSKRGKQTRTSPHLVSHHFDYSIPINTDTMRVAGYYLAEGVLSDTARVGRTARESRVIFYFNRDEVDYIEDLRTLIKRYLGTTVRCYPHKVFKTVRLETKSRGLFEFLSEFGRGAHNKHIPRWAMALPLEKQNGLLQGLYRGDGHISKSQQSIRLSSCSLNLIEDTRSILTRFNILSAVSLIKADDRQRQGALGRSGNQYVLTTNGNHAVSLGKILGIAIQRKSRSHFWLQPYIIDDNAYYPVTKIDKKPVVELHVYNLSVDTTESYIANGCCVHNCLANVEGKDYYLEGTQPKLRNPFIEPSGASAYAPVMSFNESGTEYLGGQLIEPLGVCCVRWLEDYLSNPYCTEYI